MSNRGGGTGHARCVVDVTSRNVATIEAWYDATGVGIIFIRGLAFIEWGRDSYKLVCLESLSRHAIVATFNRPLYNVGTRAVLY